MFSQNQIVLNQISLSVCHWNYHFASSHAVYPAFPLFMMTIQDNGIGDEGMLALAPVLGNLKNLTSLDLGSMLQCI